MEFLRIEQRNKCNQSKIIDANVKLKKTIDRLSDQLATQYNTTITKVVDLISTKAKQHPIATEILKTVIKRVQEDSASQHPFVEQLVQTYVSDPNGIIMQSLANSDKASSLNDLSPVQKPDTTLIGCITNAVAVYVGNMVADRLSRLAINGENSAEGDGVATGDGNFDRYGVWIKGMITQAQQKEYGLVQAYKLNQSGVTVGADIGSTHKLGATFSYAQTTVNGRGGHISKDRVKNYIGTLYGLYDFENNIFVSGQGQYGISKMKKSRDTNDLNHNTAYGKTKGTILGAKVEVG